jgi:hypothetical protein
LGSTGNLSCQIYRYFARPLQLPWGIFETLSGNDDITLVEHQRRLNLNRALSLKTGLGTISREVPESFEVDGSNAAYHAIDVFGSRSCLDPRDAVYGLQTLTPALKGIIPDYSSRTADVYITAARAIITYTRDLDILTRRNRSFKRSKWSLEELKDLPTWVPDWTRPMTFHAPQTMKDIPKLGMSGKQKMAAAVLADEDPRVLQLRGTYIDHLISCTDQLRASSKGEEKTQIRGWETKLLLPDRADVNTFIDALIHDDDADVSNDYWNVMDKARFIGYNGCQSTDDIIEEWNGWAAFTTRKGYLGRVPGAPKIGDKLFVTPHSQFPLVLRALRDEVGFARPGAFTFVGTKPGGAIHVRHVL